MKRNKAKVVIYRIFKNGKRKLHTRFNVKDRLFRYIFEEDKIALLQLYNALNGTNYSDPSALKIVTLKNVIYMSMKNDLAFVIAGIINLYEQQTSFNPNMPVRFFIYLGQEYQTVISQSGMEKKYGTKLIKLPTPRCVVFYNGSKEEPEEKILKLSDAFEHPEDQPDVELKVRMLNINFGHNKEIMEKCHRLWEYSYFVEQINIGIRSGLKTRTAVNNAVEHCIEENILNDILTESRMEVLGMLLSEFNERKYKRFIRKVAREEGLEEGRIEGRAEGRAEGRIEGRDEERDVLKRLYQKLKEAGRPNDILKAIDDPQYLEALLKEYDL